MSLPKYSEFKASTDIPRGVGDISKVDDYKLSRQKTQGEYTMNETNNTGFQHSVDKPTSQRKPQTAPKKPQQQPPEPAPKPKTAEPPKQLSPIYSPSPSPAPPSKTPERSLPRSPTPYRSPYRSPTPPPPLPPPVVQPSYYPLLPRRREIGTQMSPVQEFHSTQVWPSSPPLLMAPAGRPPSRSTEKTPPPGAPRPGSPPKQKDLAQRIQDILGRPIVEDNDSPGGVLIVHEAQLIARDDLDGQHKDGAEDGADDASKSKVKVPFPNTSKLDELSALPPITGLFVDLPVRRANEIALELLDSDYQSAVPSRIRLTPPTTYKLDALSDLPSLFGVLLEPPVRTAAELAPELKRSYRFPPRPPTVRQPSVKPPPSSMASSELSPHSSPEPPTPSEASPAPWAPTPKKWTPTLEPQLLVDENQEPKSQQKPQKKVSITSILPATILAEEDEEKEEEKPSSASKQQTPIASASLLPPSSPISPPLLPTLPEIKPPDPNNRPMQSPSKTPVKSPEPEPPSTPTSSKGPARPSVLRSTVMFKGEKQNFTLGLQQPGV